MDLDTFALLILFLGSMTCTGHSTTSDDQGHSTTSDHQGHSTTSDHQGHSTTSDDQGHSTTSDHQGHSTTSDHQGPSPTSNNQEATTTPITRVPGDKTIHLESTKAKILFSVEVNLLFSEELINKSSEKYKNYSKEFQSKLLEAYDTTPGQISIEIIGFRNGSVIADYILVLYSAAQHDLNTSLTFINDTVKGKLLNMTLSLDSNNVRINITNMSSVLENVMSRVKNGNVCEILANPCEFGYMCITNTSGVFCRDKCYSNPPQCSKWGECYVDYKYSNLKCRCQDSDEYVYSGERCDIMIRKVQALSLSTENYAIIVGSTAGAVVFILIFFHLIKCLRKKNRKEKKDGDFSNSILDLNAAEDSIQMNAASNHKHTTENNDYLHASRLPKLSKDHRVYRDPQTGEEALIYQPTTITRPLSRGSRELVDKHSEQISPRSVYDYIDTENPYKIKRPNFNESRNWPL